MKRLKAITIAVCGIIIIYVILHSTPSIALRAHLFATGHPFTSLTTGITDDETHNRVDKRRLERQNARCYTLTKPAYEKATQSDLKNYKVTKVGFLYFAEYYGDA